MSLRDEDGELWNDGGNVGYRAAQVVRRGKSRVRRVRIFGAGMGRVKPGQKGAFLRVQKWDILSSRELGVNVGGQAGRYARKSTAY